MSNSIHSAVSFWSCQCMLKNQEKAPAISDTLSLMDKSLPWKCSCKASARRLLRCTEGMNSCIRTRPTLRIISGCRASLGGAHGLKKQHHSICRAHLPVFRHSLWVVFHPAAVGFPGLFSAPSLFRCMHRHPVERFSV